MTSPLTLARLQELLAQIELHCPCGYRPEASNAFPHSIGCPVADAVELAALLALPSAPQEPPQVCTHGVALEADCSECDTETVERAAGRGTAWKPVSSAPQEPPQDCICDEDEIRLHMPDPRCEAPNCKAVASAPQEPPQADLKRKAVANCYMMAKREIARILNGKAQMDTLSLERWQHVLRFCEESGEKSSILRDVLPTEMTEGASAPQEPP